MRARKDSSPLVAEAIAGRIVMLRSERVLLDADLADLYGVETKALNRAVNRHRDRFPADFSFQLTPDETANLRYQFGTSRWRHQRRLASGIRSTGIPLVRFFLGGTSHPISVMKLPNLERAIIRAEKVSDYLLSATHPAGRHKARFFGLFGFSRAAPEVLVQALIAHAGSSEVSATVRTKFGTRYTIDEALNSPDSRNPRLRVIWFIESGGDIPNFVTAYPLPEPKT